MLTRRESAALIAMCGLCSVTAPAFSHAITLTVRDLVGAYGPDDTVMIEIIAAWNPEWVGAPVSDPSALANFQFRVDAEPGLRPTVVSFNPELFGETVLLWDDTGVEIIGGQLPPFIMPGIDRSNPFTIATIEFELDFWPQLNEVTLELTDEPSIEIYIDDFGFQSYAASIGEGAVKVEPTIVYAAGMPDFDSPCGAADLDLPYFEFDISDVIAFLNAFAAGSSVADFAAPAGVLDFNDVVGFLVAFERGCFYWG